MKKLKIVSKMLDVGAFAVIRVETFEEADRIANACIEGNLPVMEISYTNNNAGEIVRALKKKYGENLLCGAGTVLDSETARDAIINDADFIVAPNFSKEVSQICNRYQIPYGPGCSTYSEAVDALSNGSTFIKAFPISNFYGPELVSAFKTPLPHMPILASGGISLENIDEWLENGVDLCGIGSLLTKGSSEDIKNNAIKISNKISKFRKK